MLTKKNDFYKDLNLSGDLTDIEIDFDGDCEGLEDFLKKEKQEDSELQDTNQAEQKDYYNLFCLTISMISATYSPMIGIFKRTKRCKK